jgi:hypothetical protein
LRLYWDISSGQTSLAGLHFRVTLLASEMAGKAAVSLTSMVPDHISLAVPGDRIFPKFRVRRLGGDAFRRTGLPLTSGQ